MISNGLVIVAGGQRRCFSPVFNVGVRWPLRALVPQYLLMAILLHYSKNEKKKILLPQISKRLADVNYKYCIRERQTCCVWGWHTIVPMSQQLRCRRLFAYLRDQCISWFKRRKKWLFILAYKVSLFPDLKLIYLYSSRPEVGNL